MELLYRASESEIALLSQIGETSYRHHFAALWHNAKECDDFIDSVFSPASLRRSLHGSGSQWYLLMQDSPCGVVQIGTDQRRPGSELSGLCLHKFYLLPDVTGQGVGQRVFNEICAKGRELRQPLLWLEVLEQNSAARRFYTRQGMMQTHEVLFRSPTQQSRVQILSLDLS